MFHIAFPVKNIQETKQFYVEVLGASLGRSSSTWADFNLRWNQITAHETPSFEKKRIVFDKNGIPINHFGIILVYSDWKKFKDRIIEAGMEFLIEPKVFFEGEAGEQHAFFLEDPNGYAIEFKGFSELGGVFRTQR
jgi:extradiol dioxygenase family protein